MVPPEVKAIVLGASAGAIDALNILLPALPRDSKVPVIVTVHLPPSGPSMLLEIFRPKCALRVEQPYDKQAIEPGIWFAAPDYHLLVEKDRSFSMSQDEPVNFSRPSIDVLFESAAEAYGDALAAIVLTGASSDGAKGARRVRDAGGYVIVQEPAEAVVDVMPRAAIQSASPQFVGDLARIAQAMKELARS